MEKFVDDLSENVEKETSELVELLDNEFRALKFKEAKCSKRCFQEMQLPEAFQCEKKCSEAVRKVLHFANEKQNTLQAALKECLDMATDNLEGKKTKVEVDVSGGAYTCVKTYRIGLKQLQKDIIQEFSYYY